MGNGLALLLIGGALIVGWLAISGNYKGTFAALRLPYRGGSALGWTAQQRS